MLSGTGAGLSPPHALYRNHGHLHFHLAAALLLLLLWCRCCKWCRNSSNKQWDVTVRVREEFSAPFARASAKGTHTPPGTLSPPAAALTVAAELPAPLLDSATACCRLRGAS